MISEYIILQSAGSLSVAVLALMMMILQIVFFLKRSQYTWFAWSAAISFSVLLYSIGIFIEYNILQGALNRFGGLLEFTALICLVHSLTGFTFSYLGITSTRYHRVAGVCHGLILVLLWSTDYIVTQDFAARSFQGLSAPFVEPALGAFGGLFMLYTVLAGLYAVLEWVKNKHIDPQYRLAYSLGFGFWLLLGVHDGFAALGLPTFQYIMEYGFLGFALIVLWVVFDSFLEKTAQDASQISHERFLTVLNGIDSSIYVADMQTHKILFMNQHRIESFGRDMTGERCWEAFRGNSAPCPNCTNDQLIDQKGNPTGACVWQDHNQVTGRWYINHDRAIKWTDGRLARLQIATDITQFRELEKELRQTHKMEAIGRLTGGVAHEFNNILSIILGNTEMAIDDISSQDLAHELLTEVRDASLRGKDVVKQLLSYSHQYRPQKKPLHMVHTVSEVITFLRASIPANIQFKKNLWEDCSPVVADRAQIQQLIINLCNNAAQAMEETGGVLEIRLENVSVKEEILFTDQTLSPGDYVRLSISDTGHGMPAEIMEHVFDPFYTTKTADKGSGMGLSVAYGIVKGHDGVIVIESQPRQGTTIVCFFPSADIQPGTNVEETADLPTGTETILFVDDETALTTMGKRRLERLGYTVETRTDPCDALSLFRSDPARYDLVITDMTMPQMTGDQLLKELINTKPNIKTIICTGYSKKIDPTKAAQGGANAYVMKPIDQKQMARTVRNVLDAEPHQAR